MMINSAERYKVLCSKCSRKSLTSSGVDPWQRNVGSWRVGVKESAEVGRRRGLRSLLWSGELTDLLSNVIYVLCEVFHDACKTCHNALKFFCSCHETLDSPPTVGRLNSTQEWTQINSFNNTWRLRLITTWLQLGSCALYYSNVETGFDKSAAWLQHWKVGKGAKYVECRYDKSRLKGEGLILGSVWTNFVPDGSTILWSKVYQYLMK